MTTRWGSARTSGERVAICRACGGGFIPPAHGECCSERCVHYLAVASVPVLGDPLFCQRDEPIKCWGCEVSFTSRGIRFCPECYFRARPSPKVREVGVGLTQTGSPGPDCNSRSEVTPEVTPVTPTPARHDEPISDRNPRSKFCHW
jgi:hypothetical protein